MKWILVIDILNDQILLTLLTFNALQILRTVSIFCARLLFGVSYYENAQSTMFTPRRVIDETHFGEQISVGMSTNNIHLLQLKI